MDTSLPKMVSGRRTERPSRFVATRVRTVDRLRRLIPGIRGLPTRVHQYPVLVVGALLGFGDCELGLAGGRDFEVVASVRVEGNGQRYTAGIVVPRNWPEQTVELVEERTRHATGRVETVGAGGSMLIVRTKPVPHGDYAEVVQTYRVRVEPIRLSLGRDDVAEETRVSRSLGNYLKPSPGIDSRSDQIEELSRTLQHQAPHPWDYANLAFDWVHREIRYQEGDFTSAVAAVENRIGDCEEKASVFIALCRARRIPARTVWVPDHCWAEFYLVDRAGKGHWIPAHTSGPAWFGEMPSVQVILQKGDHFRPQQRGAKPTRLLAPWLKGLAPEPKWEHRLEVRVLDDERRDSEQPVGRE